MAELTYTCPFCRESFTSREWCADGECPACGEDCSEELWDDATGDYLDADSWTNAVWGVRD